MRGTDADLGNADNPEAKKIRAPLNPCLYHHRTYATFRHEDRPDLREGGQNRLALLADSCPFPEVWPTPA